MFYVGEDFLVGGAEECLVAEVAGGEEAVVVVQCPLGDHSMISPYRSIRVTTPDDVLLSPHCGDKRYLFVVSQFLCFIMVSFRLVRLPNLFICIPTEMVCDC